MRISAWCSDVCSSDPELTTGFIAEEYPEGFHGADTDEHVIRALVAIAGFMASAEADRARRTDGQLGDRLDPPAKWQVTVGGTEHKVKIGHKHIKVDGEKIDIALEYTPGDRLVVAEIGEAELAVKVARTRAGWRMTTRSEEHTSELQSLMRISYAVLCLKKKKKHRT